MTEQNASNDSPAPPMPVGRGDYFVQPGDCMESIAIANGYYWKTLWDLPENADLKEKRDPNILFPGDRVTIPDIRLGSESGATEAKHKFKKLGVPCKLKLRFLDDKMQPRKGLKYILTIDGNAQKGSLDGNGGLSVPIPPNASSGTIELQTEPDPERYELELGHLDPLETPTGVRARLINIGFSCAREGEWDDDLKDAICNYQEVRGLDVTGTLNDDTKNSLKNDYES